MSTLEQLKSEMIAAKDAAKAAGDKWTLAQQAYANAKAESLGLRVGSVIVKTMRIGYEREKKTRTTRYRITRIDYRSYGKHELSLWGITIRKDGTDGDRHEIYGDWEIEA